MGNQQTCCFSESFQWCHKTSCVSLRWMIRKCCDRFRCHGWCFQGIASEDRLGFGTYFACGAFDWHCHVGNCRRLCVVSMTRLLCLMKCKTIIGPVKFFNRTKCSAKVLSPMSKLRVAVANGCSIWPFVTCIFFGRIVDFEKIDWGLLFDVGQFNLGYCIDVS